MIINHRWFCQINLSLNVLIIGPNLQTVVAILFISRSIAPKNFKRFTVHLLSCVRLKPIEAYSVKFSHTTHNPSSLLRSITLSYEQAQPKPTTVEKILALINLMNKSTPPGFLTCTHTIPKVFIQKDEKRWEKMKFPGNKWTKWGKLRKKQYLKTWIWGKKVNFEGSGFWFVDVCHQKRGFPKRKNAKVRRHLLLTFI